MAFHITVYRQDDEQLVENPPQDVDSTEYDVWDTMCSERTLYDNPLGSGDTVNRFWSTIGLQMEAKLLPQIYDNGLKVSGAELNRLKEELNQLENYWESMDLSREEPVKESVVKADGMVEEREVPFIEHLKERAEYLREAIDIATVNEGVIYVA